MQAFKYILNVILSVNIAHYPNLESLYKFTIGWKTYIYMIYAT